MAEMTPLWWLEKLSVELGARQADMALMDAYYTGDHPLPFVTRAHEPKIRNQFRTMLEDSRSNFMRLVVDVVEERLKVDGFRLSARDTPGDDEESWRIWQANQMDSESQTAFVESLVKGMSYLSVWPADPREPKASDPHPSIAVEDPSQTIVGYVPGSNFRHRAAALKMWTDDWTGMQRANVYLPNGIYKFERKETRQEEIGTPAGLAASSGKRDGGWKEIDDSFLKNPFDVVPIVPLRNRPRLLVEGESELVDVYRVQNQINGFNFLLNLAGYFGAHRQRWAVGIKMSDDPEDKDSDSFDIAIDRMIAASDPNVKFGDFEATSLDGYQSAIEQKIRHIATTTRTPRHYLEQSGQSPSGDALKSAESGLVKKVERKQRPLGEGLEETLRLARRFAGNEEAPVDSEIVWADPQVQTEAEITDAAIKRFQARLTPWRQTMEDLGYSQTKIDSMLAQFGGVAPDPTDNPDPLAGDPLAA